VSLGIAALGIWLSQATGTILWDAVASIVIGTLLVGVAVVLALENYSLLLGEAAPAVVEARIRRLVREDDDVLDVVELRTMHMGPREILVALGVHSSPAHHRADRGRGGAASNRDQEGPRRGDRCWLDPRRAHAAARCR
jgi:divalent metal cation (Fe/Co/Zn/Cd) transporter